MRALAIGLLVLASALSAADWPCYGGADGSGALAAGTPLREDIAGLEPAWFSADPIPAAGWDVGSITHSGGLNNVVMADGRVYLSSYELSGDVVADGWEKNLENRRLQQAYPDRDSMRHRWLVGADDVVHCFDARTGATVWRSVFPGRALNFNNRASGLKTGPYMTPCVADGKVYATGAINALYCLDAATGAELWSQDAPDDYRALREKALATRTITPGKGQASDDLLNGHLQCIDDILIVPAGNTLTGRSAGTGKELWRTKTTMSGYQGPIRWTHAGVTRLIAGRSCLDPRTGKILWTAEGGKRACKQPPVVADDILVCAQGETAAIEAFRIDAAGATRLWSHGTDEGDDPRGGTAMAIMDGKLYALMQYARMARGRVHRTRMPMMLTCLDLATGREEGMVEIFHSDPGVYSLWGGDGLLFMELDRPPKGLGVIKADPADLRFLGRLDGDHGYGWCTTGCYADGRVYFRRQDRLVCYDLGRR